MTCKNFVKIKLFLATYFQERTLTICTLSYMLYYSTGVECESKSYLTSQQTSMCDACLLSLLSRTLLQQLQRLQAMVAGKVSRSCKAASTQTGTCLMVSFAKAGNCGGMRISLRCSEAHPFFYKAPHLQILNLENLSS